MRQIEQGNGEAQDVARDLLDDLEPSLVLVVGIAGARPSDDITLGDVVVSTRVYDYCVEARKPDSVEYSTTGGPIGKALAAGVVNLSARDELRGWSDNLPRQPRVQWGASGQIKGPKKWRDELADSLKFHFGRRGKPRKSIFVSGAIASSDRLVKDPTLLIDWLKTARHVLAIEMEAAGVYRAARERCPMLAIRGISDIVGLKRDEDWTAYACRSAAAFTRAYLQTQPVAVKSDEVPNADGNSVRKPAPLATTEVFVNLARLSEFPSTVYVAPAKVGTLKQAWAKLLKDPRDHIPRAWALQNKMLYSFNDPSSAPLRKIADATATEEHSAVDLAQSSDPEKRRLFVQLLNGALRDDLGIMGVRYFHDDQVFAFFGRLKEEPRTVKYRNVRQESTMTVVFHYPFETKKDGRSKKSVLLRHLCFQGRFRWLDGEWYLEINPTYRFTFDGKAKHFVHETRLKGIKRLEGNRAVLSQVLLWCDLLARSHAATTESRRLLHFNKIPPFVLAAPAMGEAQRPVTRNPTDPFQPNEAQL